MAVNLSGIRRNFKNVAHNYTDAQVKVREATSNDPWGPSSTMMSEIADLTYNVVAFSEIMQMVWKRLNDHGKNWRHVYKALVLLEYLIKTGSEKVAQQCKENIFAIQTLKDFQYLDDNKDQGINVREKAKALVALLKDDDRLKNERVRALKAKERFAQSTAGIGSDTVYNPNGTRERYPDGRPRLGSSMGGTGGGPSTLGGGGLNGGSPTSFDIPATELEAARPQTAGEEELQLQLALAMSREEQEQEETKNKSDDMRLQLALKKSKEAENEDKKINKPSSDLLDLDFGHPQMSQQPPPPTRTAASGSVQLDPWGTPKQQTNTIASNDPWGGPTNAMAAANTAGDSPYNNARIPANSDPWSPVQQNLATAATGAIPRTSPAIGLDNGSKGLDLQRNTIDNDPWNSAGVPAANVNNTNQIDMFSGLQNQNSGINGSNGVASNTNNDPWTTHTNTSERTTEAPSMDPFSPVAQSQLAEFDILRDQMETTSNGSEAKNNLGTTSPNPFDMGGMSSGVGGINTSAPKNNSSHTGTKPKSTVQTLLGEHSNLVNLDDLVTSGKQPVRNPFEQQPPNPFQAAKPSRPAMNDLLQQKTSSSWSQQPSQQSQQQTDLNPFF